MHDYKKALVLGYGRSGHAAERLLRAEETDVVVAAQESLDDAGFERILQTHAYDVCIVSPGFGLDHPWLCAVRAARVPLLSELELGWSRHRGKTVAVTGSNGKSTAVKWICESMQAAGMSAAIGGNFGIPASEVVMNDPDLEWLVLEVSSFQLETVSDFLPEIGVVLNILPNHLDRHGSMGTYFRTKARIFGSSRDAGGTCIVPAALLERFCAEVGHARNWITFGADIAADYRFDASRIYRDSSVVLDLTGTPFENPVVGACTGAAMAAVAAAAGIPPAALEAAAQRFDPLPHRMQPLGRIGGITYIDDSKATNLAAMAAAVSAIDGGIHLLAGGLPKESDYTFVKEILAERVRRIYLIGQASRAMYQAWNGVCPCVECGTLERAFRAAEKSAKAGETILLSPACASFDQFRSFEERGARFNALFQKAMHAGGDAV